MFTTKNEKRTWGQCTKCSSATITSFLNPKSGMCKVCDARRLADAVYVQPLTSAPEKEIAVDFGYDAEVTIDEEGNVRELADDGETVIVDSTMTADERRVLAKRARRLEASADDILARAAARDAELAALAEAEQALRSSQDPAQFVMNKARDTIGLALRGVKEPFTPASAKQIAALHKLGWNADLVRASKLTIAEASRLLQRGPQW